jgi:hypothetical protein
MKINLDTEYNGAISVIQYPEVVVPRKAERHEGNEITVLLPAGVLRFLRVRKGNYQSVAWKLHTEQICTFVLFNVISKLLDIIKQ